VTGDAERVLAIDLGTKRIGLAVSDRLGLAAHPLPVLTRRGPREDLRELARVVRDHEVDRVVVGLPRLMSGEEGTAAAGARSFADSLKSAIGEMDVDLWDERLTTVEAERMLIESNVKRRKRKQIIDSVAATLILQDWLESRPTGDSGKA
jgi:putative Holliday junction resolvase